MATRIKLRRDTTANWESVNPILANGEMGIEADTRRVKLGDGATAWNDLKYAITDQLKISGKTVNSEMGVSIASQDPETWISTVKSKCNWSGVDGIAYDSMGNLYMSGWEEFGYDLNSGGSGKAYLIKYDPKGTVLWSKYTDLLGYTEGTGVTVDSEDNAIVVNIAWDESYTSIAKYTEDGAVIWQKKYLDSYDMARGFGVEVDGNDDIVLVGRRQDPDHDANRGIFAMKIIGSSGEIAWTKTMARWYTDAYQPSVAIDGDKNIIISGSDSQNNDGQAVISKISTDGSVMWTRTLRSQEGEWNGYELDLGSLDADADGNIYFLGSYKVPGFVVDLQGSTWDGRAGLVVKMDSEGVVLWSRITGPGDCNDLGAQLVYKEGKLYATFQTERPYYKNDIAKNDQQGYTTQEIVLACYDADNGKVLWQNKFGPEILWGYSSPNANTYNYQDRTTESGRLIAVHKDYVAVAGQAGVYSRVEDNNTRSYAFLAQLPADGTEMDLEGWEYKKTKYPGQYAAVKTEGWSYYDVNSTSDITAVTLDYEPDDTADNVRIDLLASGANQWDFKPNGDLALPVGGNIEISRPTTGDINVYGYFDQDNNNGLWNMFNSVTTDPDGNRYYAGVWNFHGNSINGMGDNDLPMVVKVNAQGQTEWKVRLSNFNLYGYDAVYGQAKAIAYDPASGNIVLVAIDSGEGNDDQMLIVDLNAVNGDVIESKRYRGPSDISPNGIAINTLGERFITGGMQGSNYLNFTVTNSMAVVGHNDTIDVPVTVFAGHDAPDWRLGTSGWYIGGGSNLNAIDYYDNVTGTVREGSGASFDVVISQVTTATMQISNLTNATVGGASTLVGSTYTSGGGNDYVIFANDSALRDAVSAVTGGNSGVIRATWSAGSTVESTYVYLQLVDANTFQFFASDISGNPVTGTWIFPLTINDGQGGNITSVTVNSGGTNYLPGHKITLPYTAFNGTDTNSNIILTVTGATDGVINTVSSGYGGGGGATGGTYTAVTGTNRDVGSGFSISVQVDANTATNNLIVYHYSGGTNYVAGDVITFAGTNFGGTSTATDVVITALQVGGVSGDIQSGEDYGYAVTQRGVSPLTQIRLQFSGQDFTSGGPTYNLLHYTDSNTFIAKFNPAGSTSTNLVWAKWIEKSNYDEGVAVDYDSDGNLYWLSRVYDEYEPNQGNWRVRPAVVKLDSDGNKIWAKTYSYDGYEGLPTGLQVDSEDRVVMLERHWYQNNWEYHPVVTRIDQDGSKIWQKMINLYNGEGDGGGLALDNDDNVYIVMDRYDGEDDVRWTSKLDIMDGRPIWQHDISNENRNSYQGWDGDYSNSIATDGKTYHVAGMTWDLDGNEGCATAISLPADGSAEDTQVGPFAITNTFYGTEGSGDSPVDRTYAVTTATDQFTLITDRQPIKTWIEVSPTNYYPVYTKSDAGIVFGDGTVQTTSASGMPQVRHNRYDKEFKLKLSDAGKHLYMTNSDQTVIIPNYSEVQFPVGTVITIVNLSGGYVYVGAYGDWRTTMYCPSQDGNEGSLPWFPLGWRFYDNGGGNFITLLKVEESYSNGSRWVINGNNASNWG